MVDLNLLLSVSQVAKRTVFSEPQIRNAINEGRLKATRLAGSIYVHESDLDTFLKTAKAK